MITDTLSNMAATAVQPDTQAAVAEVASQAAKSDSAPHSAVVLIFLGILVFAAHVFASLYSRKKIPDVLLLMLIGLLIGPILGLVSPESFGMTGPVFAAITLVVILFEGGTSLSFSVMRSAWKSTLSLTASCFFLSMILCMVIGYIFQIGILGALVLGAILGGTSSAVVIPLVRMLHIGEESRTVLVLESAATDVLCIVFALAFMQAATSGAVRVGAIVGGVLSSFLLAGLVGFGSALLWSRLITSIRKLQNSIFTTPAFVFVVYGVTEILGWSGAIAALVFGITMANIESISSKFFVKIMGGKGHKLNKTEMVFFGELVFLLKTLFFVYIGISIKFNDWKSILAGLIITFALFFGRILVARFLSPKTASPFDKTVISMMIPKGLAAAVLASMPLQMGLAGGEFIQNTTYATIFFSITWVSVLILLVDKVPFVRHTFEKMLAGRADEVKSIFVEVKDTDTDANGVVHGEAYARTPFAFLAELGERREEVRNRLHGLRQGGSDADAAGESEAAEKGDSFMEAAMKYRDEVVEEDAGEPNGNTGGVSDTKTGLGTGVSDTKTGAKADLETDAGTESGTADGKTSTISDIMKE